MASQITSLTMVYSIVYTDVDQRKHLSSAPLAFVRRIHRGPVNSPHKRPVTRKMFPFDDVIMISKIFRWFCAFRAIQHTYGWNYHNLFNKPHPVREAFRPSTNILISWSEECLYGIFQSRIIGTKNAYLWWKMKGENWNIIYIYIYIYITKHQKMH